MQPEAAERLDLNGSSPRRTSATAARRVVAAEREEKALRLRASGATFRQISQALGISVGGAHRLVAHGLQRAGELCEQEARDLRALEAERLDMLLLSHMPKAAAGCTKSGL